MTKFVGFYKELGGREYLGELPSIRDALEGPAVGDEEQILAYLESCPEIFTTLGAEPDVISRDENIPYAGSLITDGAWVWPIDLIYYLRRYHLALPDDFLEHVRKNNYRAPEVPASRQEEVLDTFLPPRCPDTYQRPTGGFVSWFLPPLQSDDCRVVFKALEDAGLPVIRPSSGEYSASQCRPGRRVVNLGGADIRGLINQLVVRLAYHDVAFECWPAEDRPLTAYTRQLDDRAVEITFDLGQVAAADQERIVAALVRAFDGIHERSQGFVIDRNSASAEIDWSGIVLGRDVSITVWPDTLGIQQSLVHQHPGLARKECSAYGPLAVFNNVDADA